MTSRTRPIRPDVPVYSITVCFLVAANSPTDAILIAAQTITNSESVSLGQMLTEQLGPCEISGHEIGTGFARKFGGFQ